MEGKTISNKITECHNEENDQKPKKKICRGQCNATGKATGLISENTLRAEQKLIAHSALPAADVYYYEKNSTADGDTYRQSSSGC